jgi:hypothetical protein
LIDRKNKARIRFAPEFESVEAEEMISASGRINAKW